MQRRDNIRALGRGFTLIELLAVVAIVGILAALAIYGYRKYIEGAQSSEAQAVIQGIRAGQEAYRAETLTYLDCSADLDTLHPRARGTLDGKKVSWTPGADAGLGACFRQLNVSTDGPVKFGYAVSAGLPGGTYPAAPTDLVNWPTLGASTEPWYIVAAQGNRDEDTVYAIFVATSFSKDIYFEQETE